MSEPVFFATAAKWREWLDVHHSTQAECLVGFIKVTTGHANMSWSESVDEALCYGWIDGVRRGIDADTYSIRFTRRKPGSTWSAVNISKIEALRAAGRMTAAGEAAFAKRSEKKSAIYSYEKEPGQFSAAELTAFKAAKGAWAFWQAQATWYRRNATHWVIDAKRAETRVRRFAQLVEDSTAGRRLRHLSR